MIYRQNFTFYQKKTGFAAFARATMTAIAGVFVLLMMTHKPVMAEDLLATQEAHETVFPTDILLTKDGPDDGADDGAGFSIAAHEGALLVNFWATWCAPCVHELPDLVAAAKGFAQRGEALDVVLISVDRKGPDHAQAFLDERGINVAHERVISAYNPTSTWPRELGLRGLPSSYLISADRTKIFLIQGPALWADEAIMDEIAAKILAP